MLEDVLGVADGGLLTSPVKLGRAASAVLLVLFLATSFAGCVQDAQKHDVGKNGPKKIVGTGADSVFEGTYRFDGSYSYTLVNGTFAFAKDTPFTTPKIRRSTRRTTPINSVRPMKCRVSQVGHTQGVSVTNEPTVRARELSGVAVPSVARISAWRKH